MNDKPKSQDALPAPVWPKQNLDTLLKSAFEGHTIGQADHPALLPLIGAETET